MFYYSNMKSKDIRLAVGDHLARLMIEAGYSKVNNKPNANMLTESIEGLSQSNISAIMNGKIYTSIKYLDKHSK